MTQATIARRPELVVREPFVPLILFAVGMAATLVKLLPSFYISATIAAMPVQLHPLEYVPGAVGIILIVYFAPRFRLWELLGTRRNSVQALTTTVVVLVLPFAMSLLAATTYPESDMNPKLMCTNVLVACALASILIGALGRLWGLIAFLAAYFGFVVIAAERPDLARFGPRTLFHIETRTYDHVQWVWVLTLIAVALLYAWIRRNVPLRTT